MSSQDQQLDLELPTPSRSVSCISPVNRLTHIPPVPTRPAGGLPTSLPRPWYRTVDDAPIHVVQEAFHKRYVWIQRYVEEGGPTWKLVAFATERARSVGLPEHAAPAQEQLVTWVQKWSYWGFLGLLRRPR